MPNFCKISKISENFCKFWQNLATFWKNVILELCKGVHCVDLGESFPTSIYLQNLASIQPRTSPLKFRRRSRRTPPDSAAEFRKRAWADASALSKLNSWRLLKLIKIKSARSRLYRSRFLQVNTRWKALAEIYTMHSFAPLSDLKISLKIAELFSVF